MGAGIPMAASNSATGGDLLERACGDLRGLLTETSSLTKSRLGRRSEERRAADEEGLSIEQLVALWRLSNHDDLLLSLISWSGDNFGPRLLWRWWERGDVPAGALHAYVAQVWSNAELPEDWVGRENWIDLFRQAGYPSPELPLTLFRGTHPERRLGMAWTTNIDVARHFADRWVLSEGEPMPVYRTEITAPTAVLCEVGAVLSESRGLNECEVIVDPSRLGRVMEVERRDGTHLGL